MPPIPVYRSQQTPTSQAPAPLVSPGANTFAGRSIERQGAQVQQVADKFLDLQNLNEYTGAVSEANKNLNEMWFQAQQDQDIDTLESRYSEEATKIREDALQSVSTQAVRDRLKFQLDTAVNAKMLDIRRMQRQKQIEVARFQFNDVLEENKTAIISTDNPLSRQQLMDQAIEGIDLRVNMGVYSPAEALKLKDAFRADVATSQVRHDIELDPDMALTGLKKNHYGDLGGDRKTLIKEAENAIKRNEQIAEDQRKQIQAQNAIQFTERLWNGELSLNDVQDAMTSGQISLSFAEQMHKALTSDKAPLQSKATTFNKLALEYEDLFKERKGRVKAKSGVEMADIEDFMGKVVNAYGKGEIDPADGQLWLRHASQAVDPMLEDAVAEKNPRGGIKALKFWVDGLDSEEKEEMKARLSREMMKRVMNGEDPDEVTDQVIEREQKQMNPNRTRFKIGDVVPTPAGPVKVIGYYPDGEPEVEPVNQ